MFSLLQNFDFNYPTVKKKKLKKKINENLHW